MKHDIKMSTINTALVLTVEHQNTNDMTMVCQSTVGMKDKIMESPE